MERTFLTGQIAKKYVNNPKTKKGEYNENIIRIFRCYTNGS